MKKKTEEINPQAELMMALDMLEKEKGINKTALLDAIETALVSAYKRITTTPATSAFPSTAKRAKSACTP